jgi:hypothetical protein
MSGLRPDVTAIFNFDNHIREMNQPSITTLPQSFKDAGWTVLGGGKTFHISLPPDWDQQHSWTTDVQPYYPFWEYGDSSDFASCPHGASACAVNGSMNQLCGHRLPHLDIMGLASS